jgi:hypothetical protein
MSVTNGIDEWEIFEYEIGGHCYFLTKMMICSDWYINGLKNLNEFDLERIAVSKRQEP